jgi:hypothetical protein
MPLEGENLTLQTARNGHGAYKEKGGDCWDERERQLAGREPA